MADEAPDTGPVEWLKEKLGIKGKEPASAGNRTAQDAADAAARGEDPNTPSNTGPAGQSTDSQNKY